MSVNKGLSIYKNGAGSGGVTPEEVEEKIFENGVILFDQNVYFDDVAKNETNVNKYGPKVIFIKDNRTGYSETLNRIYLVNNWSYWNSKLGLLCIEGNGDGINNFTFLVQYCFWNRNAGQTKGGKFIDNVQFYKLTFYPPTNTSGTQYLQHYYSNGNHVVRWLNIPGGQYLLGADATNYGIGSKGIDPNGASVILFYWDNIYNFNDGKKHFLAAYNRNINYYEINEVPATSGHLNQTLRSKNDGSFGWEPTINDIRLYYDSNWKIDKNYTDIKALINLDRPVRVKLEVGTNDNIYLDFVRDYTNSGTQATDYLIFQRNLIDVAAGSMDCYTLKIMGDNTISYTHTIYTM